MTKLPLKRRILITGEGRETEYNYFIGFRQHCEKELEAAATSVSVRRGKGGSARNIVDKAIQDAKNFAPDPKRGDRVFLVMDTEGPGRASELPEAERSAKRRNIEIIYSCPSIEYWFLCHFKNAPRKTFNNCQSVIDSLGKKWPGVCDGKYDKADTDIFKRLASGFMLAREQSLKIDLHHLSLHSAARCQNPSTQVYELIGILIGAQTGEKCPIGGFWGPIGEPRAAIPLQKGEQVPCHKGSPARWKLIHNPK